MNIIFWDIKLIILKSKIFVNFIFYQIHAVSITLAGFEVICYLIAGPVSSACSPIYLAFFTLSQQPVTCPYSEQSPSTPRPPILFPHKTSARISLLPRTCYMSCPSHPLSSHANTGLILPLSLPVFRELSLNITWNKRLYGQML